MSDLRRTPSRREAAPAPRAAGFRMPAEWEPHHATWLVWPHARADWEVKTTAVEWCFADIARNLVRGERVAIVYHDEAVRQRAERRLRRTGVDLNRIDRTRDPDESLLDPRLRTALRRARTGCPVRGRGDRLAIQRLGALSRLAA